MIIKNDFDDLIPYLTDSSNLKGKAEICYIPENIEEIKEVLKQNSFLENKITISGAGTGLTGARVPNGGVILSTEKLKKIIEIGENYAIIEPGVTLSELTEELNKSNKLLPPNPTEINASIGGNIAANASGSRTFKYGAIRDWVLALDIIFPNGDFLTLNRGEIYSKNGNFDFVSNNGNRYNFSVGDINMPKVKNASGYFLQQDMDLIDLFIGSEGTLCCFGNIKLKIIDKPRNTLGLIVFFDKIDNLFEFTNNIRDFSKLNNKISIEHNQEIAARLIEYFDQNSLELLKNKFPQIPKNSIGSIWIEQEYNIEYEDLILEKWNNIINKYTAFSDDIWIALNDKEHENLREFRHELPLQVYENLTENSQKKIGLDTALPIENFDKLFYYYINQFDKINLKKVVFGHIGNCHLHANLFCNNEEEYKLAMKIYQDAIDIALENKGTVSAEHGIGKLKTQYLNQMYGQNNIEKMKRIKKVFDPKSLLNIGNIFD